MTLAKSVSGFELSTYGDLDISVRLMPDELLCPLLHNFRFREGSEGHHGDCKQDK